MKSSLSADDVMRAPWYMTAASLCAAVILAAPAAHDAEASAAPIDGADVTRLITQTLAAQGLIGAPSIRTDRLFPACDTALKIEPMFGSWNTVAVRCTAGSGWRFNIRTNLSSRPAPVPIRDFQAGVAVKAGTEGWAIDQAVLRVASSKTVVDEIEVVALSRSVSRNDVIGAGDLVMVAVSERNALGAFFDPADVIGRRMKIGVGVNLPLMARHLHPDFLVEEGNEVLISSYTGGISVDMIGYALENGQIGEWIGVENASSGKKVRGKITGEKKVTVIAKN